jgi:hypothetical protein
VSTMLVASGFTWTGSPLPIRWRQQREVPPTRRTAASPS